MSRPKDSHRKVEISQPAAPLQSNPFALLGELDALKNLPPAPEPAEGTAFCGLRPQVARATQGEQKARGRLVLRRETKDRGGKIVVVIGGFSELPGANAVMIGNLARELKGKLGCGGSFDRQEIVLQGDRCAEVAAQLELMGFRVAGVRT